MVYILESDYMISYEAAKDSRCYFTQNFNLFKTIQNNLNPCMFYIEQCIFFKSKACVKHMTPNAGRKICKAFMLFPVNRRRILIVFNKSGISQC